METVSKGRYGAEVLAYAESIRSGKKVACKSLKLAIDRFYEDLENPAYSFDIEAPDFCIYMIEHTLCHQQGERLDGTPLRGEKFLLEPFHKFIIYNFFIINLNYLIFLINNIIKFF